MSDPDTGLTDDELLAAQAYADQTGETIAIEDDFTRNVYDVHSTFNVLWVPRSGTYDVAALFGANSANEFAKVFKGGSGRWLRNTEDEVSDVLNASWHKDVEGPFGSFSFSLRPRAPNELPYIDMLRPGDLVFLYSDENATHNDDPFDGTLITYGIISKPSMSMQSEGGPDVENTSVSGADLGIIFSKTETVFDQAFSEIANLAFTNAWFERLFSQASAGSPLEHVLTLLDLIFNAKATGSQIVAAQWQLLTQSTDPTSLVQLIDMSTYVQPAMFGYSLAEVFAIAQAGNVWSLIRSYANTVVNECFFDVRDYVPEELEVTEHLASLARGVISTADANRQLDVINDISNNQVFASAKSNANTPDGSSTPVMSLVFRQRPYDRDSFNKLPTTVIRQTEILDEETGLSDHDVSNFFRIRFPAMPNEFQELIYGIHVNLQSVHRFGIRRMEAETRYSFGSSDASASYGRGESRPQDFSDVFDWYCGLLATWYAANEEMKTTTMTIRYRPGIRVGTRVIVQRKTGDWAYYVQGLSQSWVEQAGGSQTQLTLTRGINMAEDRLVNNLIWTPTGSGIPPQLDPYGRFTASGFDFQSGAVRVINQQQGA